MIRRSCQACMVKSCELHATDVKKHVELLRPIPLTWDISKMILPTARWLVKKYPLPADRCVHGQIAFPSEITKHVRVLVTNNQQQLYSCGVYLPDLNCLKKHRDRTVSKFHMGSCDRGFKCSYKAWCVATKPWEVHKILHSFLLSSVYFTLINTLSCPGNTQH